MGTVHAEIELINGGDMANARTFKIGEEEIRRITVTMLVDTGAFLMCINENIQSYLGLPFIRSQVFQLADGKLMKCDIVGPVEVRFANRDTRCDALVLPGDSEPLLGLIPMEAMDVLVHPNRQELIVNPAHPEGAVLRL
ncbi:retropepsin-like aspartic protease [Puia dinghuensis]|uniref:Clan AA aspartic protease n=1 Tax=Puia dinghuensis TaxID=1792502 RepID=A0A8J2UAN2_9BACT|nr:retropepsin-like aspartic protease [Puia dinghuensis]GGA90951.1 hypothetical protein GCM10011511_12820 [Puia dinghuensis]